MRITGFRIPAGRCRRCRVKWSQAATGFCRGCGREASVVDYQSIRDGEAARIAAQAERLERLRTPEEERTPRPPVHRVVEGVLYEITWDGS
jgi:predicted Fe-S protein YdhL (DUF1289 family)